MLCCIMVYNVCIIDEHFDIYRCMWSDCKLARACTSKGLIVARSKLKANDSSYLACS